jgi:hypothetical protein
MSTTDVNIDEILSAVKGKANSDGIDFLVPELQEFQVDRAKPGMIILTAGCRERGDKLKYKYAYKDADGVTVLLSIVLSTSSVIKEIELWRGDGKNILRIADPVDLFVPPMNRPF